MPTLAREEASHYSSSPVPETGPTHAGGGSTYRVGFVHHHGEVGAEGGGKEWDGRRLSVPESVRESLLQRAPERKGGREGDKLRRASLSLLLVMLAPCWPRVNKREREEEQSRQNSGEKRPTSRGRRNRSSLGRRKGQSRLRTKEQEKVQYNEP